MLQNRAMFGLYRDTAALAFRRAVKAWPVAFSLIVYAVIFAAAARLLVPLGIVGGLLLGLVAAACASGYLYLLLQAVRGTPLRFDDFKRGFAALFWDVISVMFALWIIGLLVSLVVRGAGERGDAIAAMVALAMAFFLNPVPELIYLGKSRSFDLLLESSRFVMANPLVWFLPNLLFALVLLAPTGALAVSHPGELLLVFTAVFSPGGLAATFGMLPLWLLPLLLLLVHYAMVFRGLLFEALSSGSARRRAWQSRS
jgi:hypothetical protein